MTKAIRWFFASLFLGTAILAAAQQARVEVPFEFHIAGQTLPAGTYEVKRAFDRDDLALTISGAAGQSPVAFLVHQASPNQYGSGLSFNRYGDSYYLSGVTMPSGKFSLARSRQERMVAVTADSHDTREVVASSK